MMDELTVTPQHQLMPQLHWCGKLLGRNIYVDTNDLAKRQLIEDLIENMVKRFNGEL